MKPETWYMAFWGGIFVLYCLFWLGMYYLGKR